MDRAAAVTSSRGRRPHDEAQAAVRFAYGALRQGGRIAAREDEAGIAGTLGPGHERLAAVGGDDDIIHAGNAFRVIDTAAVLEDARARNRDHHHCRGAALPLERRQRHAEGVAQDDLLERDAAVSEAQHRGAAPADRPGRQLDEPRALLVESQLGVDRALTQAESTGCCLPTLYERCLLLRRVT